MGYTCATCGDWHEERPTAFLAPMPNVVAGLSDTQRATRVVISSDLCILDKERFFILGNLELPVRDSSETITWTVWSTLSEADFDRCVELWHAEGRESEPPYAGSLGNDLPGYPRSTNIKVLVHTQPLGIRPTIEVVEGPHPLHRDQTQGITAARAQELIEAALHPAG